jgi:hypothetical protein
VASGQSSATSGNGNTNVVTSASLPAGTYLVGGNFYTTSTTTFTNTDTIDFFITSSGLVLFPQTTLTGYSQAGSNPADIVASVTGLLVLTTAATITWSVFCAFTTATGKTTYVSNPFYQRVA